MAKLNPKQAKFCQEYLVDLNGSQAAIRAGYSSKAAKELASRLLTKDNVKAEVQRLIDARAARTEITADWVLNGIKDLTDKLVESDDPKAAYKGYELGGRHLKMFVDRQDVNVSGDVKVTSVSRKIVKSNN